MGIVRTSIRAHDQANRFKAVESLGTVGTVFRAGRRLPEPASLFGLGPRSLSAPNVKPLVDKEIMFLQ